MPTINDIALLLNVAVPGDVGAREVTGVSTLVDAGPEHISVVVDDRYVREYKKTRAAAVLVSKKVKFPVRADVAALVVEDADLALVKVLEYLAPPIPHPPAGIHPTAVIAADAVLGENVAIGPHVVVGINARIGARTRLHPGVVIGDETIVGDDCTLFANVVLRERVTLGHRIIIHAGSVIGTDGFGYRWNGRQHTKIPQVGTVVIEDDVEIGSCTCIDRAKFDVTRIGRGTKIDNLVQIAHNVRVGMHAIVCGQAGLAGTSVIGNGVVLGGACSVRDHIHVGDGVIAGGRTAIAEDIEPRQMISGMPALPHRQHLREQGALRRLPEIVVTVRQLQEQILELQKRLDQQTRSAQNASEKQSISESPATMTV
jgi:UDP-3-O-[3-hydroxymyristoyl] glucosamine N-acyltransferase